MSAQRVLGLLLVALGAALIVVLSTGIGGESIVAFLGAGFLAAYIATRAYGFLIPGAILTGLGLGVIFEAQGASGGFVVLGLGAGFLTIAVIDLLGAGTRPAWWWPIIPGGVLTTVGAAQIAELGGLGRYVVPTALVIVGLVLLLHRAPRREAVDATEDVPEPRAYRT
jgi:hypothetical protein